MVYIFSINNMFLAISSKILLLCAIFGIGNSENGLYIIQRTGTSFLEKYELYADALIIHLEVPEGISFASFKFVARELQYSIFGCSPRDVSLYMKQKSLPVINPDNSKFPSKFKPIPRTKLYNLEFKSDRKENYINITSPEPGSYYAATFLSYSDPRYNPIKQDGLGPQCFAEVEAILYVEGPKKVAVIKEDLKINTILLAKQNTVYKFYIPELIDHAILILQDIIVVDKANITIGVQARSFPSATNFIASEELTGNQTSLNMMFWTKENIWHYIKFSNYASEPSNATFTFTLKYFSSYSVNDSLNITKNNNQVNKTFSKYLTNISPYTEYELVRDASSESFLYSYQLNSEIESSTPVPINMTNKHFSSLKFNLAENSDGGGTLKFIMAFKPRVVKEGSKITLEVEPEDHIIVACIQADGLAVPTWPNKCVLNEKETESPLILNKTVENATVYIPYPESGVWYATFKLFCEKCEPCNCSKKCQEYYETCLTSCQLTCSNGSKCDCVENCKIKVTDLNECDKCDCDGPCKVSNKQCNSSIVYDIGSTPCITGECSKNGKCMYMISGGIVYSTCVCTNKYRGWDCSDDTLATPHWLVLLELLLLVLSNLFFLPAVYVALTRKYYVEALCYFSICFFSTFYHACDAGENILSMCVARLSALQFADFFCALLAIWVTLIAIADLPSYFPSLCQMSGAIILSFCTTLSKTSLWIFAVPAISGLLIICINWALKYKKVKQMFLNKKYLYIYLPVGSVVVLVGLIIYGLLQTTDNYKYLHSMWHVIMAIAVMILLPKRDTFQPGPLSSQGE